MEMDVEAVAAPSVVAVPWWGGGGGGVKMPGGGGGGCHPTIRRTSRTSSRTSSITTHTVRGGHGASLGSWFPHPRPHDTMLC